MSISGQNQFPKQEYEEIRKFISEHESIKDRNSVVPAFSGDRWMLLLNRGGYYILDNIFKEDVEFYWSRSRVLEKLNSLPPGTLPAGVQPTLGPDANAGADFLVHPGGSRP